MSARDGALAGTTKIGSFSRRGILRIPFSTSKKGKVKVTVISEQGKEAVVAILGPDEFCGEGCLAGQQRRMATATAMAECEIMRLEKSAIVLILHEEPTFSEMFVAHLLARTIRVEEDLVDQLFNSSEKRLARALL